MKIVSIISILFVGFSCVTQAQTVTIGTQLWMTKNLDVSTFKNGEPIPQAKTDEEWKKAGENNQPAWCYYKNDTKKGKKYGKLYNWFAVNDPRGLAPEGWHVATSKEFESLLLNLGGNIKLNSNNTTQQELIKKLKSPNWNEKKENNQLSNFNLLPSSFRYDGGSFGKENNCNILFKDKIEFSISGTGVINYSEIGNENVEEVAYGFSVRCLKD